MQILVFGDSITYGAWDKKGGWVERLKRDLNQKTIDSKEEFYCMTYNLGIDGNTTTDLLNRSELETKARLLDDDIIIIFDVGGNDSCFDKSKGNFLTPQQDFKGNIQKLINLAKKFSSKIFFVGLIPADELRTTPVFWDKDKFYKNEHIKKYDNIIKSVCLDNNINFIDTFNKFSKLNYKSLLEDGLHPNSKGHELIYEEVKKVLKF